MGLELFIFGELPSGEVCGQMVNESVLRDGSRKVYELIVLQIVPEIHKKIIDGKEIIELSFRGTNKPYSCKGICIIKIADEDKIVSHFFLSEMT